MVRSMFAPLVKRTASLGTLQEAMHAKRYGVGAKTVSDDQALMQSAVWAACRLRADMISSLPLDVFRYAVGPDGVKNQVEVPKPPILINPSGGRVRMREFLYSTQMDLDRVGNAYGIIREVDAAGRPSRIELQQHGNVTVVSKDGVITYRIRNGKDVAEFPESQIWHERQHTLPGTVMGLSPVANAAWSLGLWSSAQAFGLEWFGNHGMVPSGVLKNISQTIDKGEAQLVKDQYKAAIQDGDIFVTGKDWEWTTQNAATADQRFMELQKYTDQDAVRFFGVPGDLVEVEGNASNVTYANVTQRNLQFLVINLGPAIGRREEALSQLLAAPRFVKFNTDAILRMDPRAVSDKLIAEVSGKITAPSEARALLNRPPFTPEQIQEFTDLNVTATKVGTGITDKGSGTNE